MPQSRFILSIISSYASISGSQNHHWLLISEKLFKKVNHLSKFMKKYLKKDCTFNNFGNMAT